MTLKINDIILITFFSSLVDLRKKCSKISHNLINQIIISCFNRDLWSQRRDLNSRPTDYESEGMHFFSFLYFKIFC